MVILQYVSILIEALIAILGVLTGIKKKKQYGWGIFLTFFIYFFYDSFKLIGWSVPELILNIMFFVATVSALASVWAIYKEKKK
jgi:hypothetical protein